MSSDVESIRQQLLLKRKLLLEKYPGKLPREAALRSIAAAMGIEVKEVIAIMKLKEGE